MPVALTIKDLKVRSLDIDFNEVSWTLADTIEDVLDYNFQVLRSESPSGPFDDLSVPFQDKYLFIDNTLEPAHRWRTLFYKVRITHLASGDAVETDPVTREPEPDRIALELRRHMQLLFREFAGRRCWVLPVRTFGQRCECWNNVMKQRRAAGCRLCFDTGFVRGYHSPIETWMDIDPSPKSEQTTNVGAQQQSNTTGKFGHYPSLKPRDIIIEPENRRWRVGDPVQIEHLRARVWQQFKLHEIPLTDVEYAIELDLGTALRNLWLAPARNFTHPQNLATFEQEEIPGIFSLYPTTYPDPHR